MSVEDLHTSIIENARAVAVLRRQAEHELRKSKAIAESTEIIQREFVATLSHEMRTPLNAIIGFSEGLSSGIFGPIENEQHAEYIGYIHKSAMFLLGLIDEVLDYARLEQYAFDFDPGTFHIVSWMSQCHIHLEAEALKHRVAFGMVFNGHSQAVLCSDQRRLTQVLFNLVGNALKFAEGGAVQVVIEVRGQPSNGGEVERLRVEVADNGVGISPTDQPRVFERFARLSSPYARRHGGLGLGLSICKRLINLLGGEIGFSSVPNKETIFWFEVPSLPVRKGAL